MKSSDQVNGIIVMKDSEPIKRFDAGQPIRFEVQEKGRFEPLTLEGWTKEFYAVPIDFGGGVPGSQPEVKENPLRQVEKKGIEAERSPSDKD